MNGNSAAMVPWQLTDSQEFGPALIENLGSIQLGQAIQFFEDRGLEVVDRLRWSSVSAANRLRHDTVNHAKRLQIARGNPHRLGRIGRLVRGSPQDRSTAFGRND